MLERILRHKCDASCERNNHETEDGNHSPLLEGPRRGVVLSFLHLLSGETLIVMTAHELSKVPNIVRGPGFTFLSSLLSSGSLFISPCLDAQSKMISYFTSVLGSTVVSLFARLSFFGVQWFGSSIKTILKYRSVFKRSRAPDVAHEENIEMQDVMMSH